MIKRSRNHDKKCSSDQSSFAVLFLLINFKTNFAVFLVFFFFYSSSLLVPCPSRWALCRPNPRTKYSDERTVTMISRERCSIHLLMTGQRWFTRLQSSLGWTVIRWSVMSCVNCTLLDWIALQKRYWRMSATLNKHLSSRPNFFLFEISEIWSETILMTQLHCPWLVVCFRAKIQILRQPTRGATSSIWNFFGWKLRLVSPSQGVTAFQPKTVGKVRHCETSIVSTQTNCGWNGWFQ